MTEQEKELSAEQEQTEQPKGRKRKVQINIRITEEEAEQLKLKVEKSGMSQQEYILKCVLEKEVTNTDGVKEIVPELKRIGNNLNQIAHHMNGGGYPSLQEVKDNQKELSDIWQSLRRFLQKQA